MIDFAHSTARALVFQQMDLIPVDQTLVDDALGATERVIASLDPTLWSLVRPGEGEPDVGLVYRPGKGNADHKYFFHYSHDLKALAWGQRLSHGAIHHELIVIERLYSELNRTALAIGAALEDILPSQLGGVLVKRMLQSMNESHPFATTTLRGLWYPAHAGQKGARAHLDRSFLTLHLGDEGGSLLALSNENDPHGRVISPRKGNALVFCGVKMLELARGRLTPLWHKSTVEANRDRKALVHFVHVPTAVQVTDAKETFVAYRG